MTDQALPGTIEITDGSGLFLCSGTADGVGNAGTMAAKEMPYRPCGPLPHCGGEARETGDGYWTGAAALSA